MKETRTLVSWGVWCRVPLLSTATFVSINQELPSLYKNTSWTLVPSPKLKWIPC
jgi:hypothetical protein